MAAPRLTLNRSQRLKQSRDFSRVRAAGRRLVHGCLIANWQPLPPGSPSHLGIVTSGKIGNAVVRNRTRRRLKEAARLELAEHLVSDVDLVLIGREATRTRPFLDLRDDLRRALRKAGVDTTIRLP